MVRYVPIKRICTTAVYCVSTRTAANTKFQFQEESLSVTQRHSEALRDMAESIEASSAQVPRYLLSPFIPLLASTAHHSTARVGA